MKKNVETILTVFYCQNSFQENKRTLESQVGPRVRLFPIPCSGRLEPLFLLRALEGGADAACLFVCPEGACRYFEGNRRASKRVAYTKKMLKEIGLEEDRVFITFMSANEKRPPKKMILDALVAAEKLGPSPLNKAPLKEKK
ncbi:MAG: hydrogenase iron-sulfur subunit [Deltaproteobacteria bacterium]|nr:hydrogenase iron-sulfur subunit [Deltaproteobacteria bacterium]